MLCTTLIMHGMEKPIKRPQSLGEVALISSITEQQILKKIRKIDKQKNTSKIQKAEEKANLYLRLAQLYDKDTDEYADFFAQHEKQQTTAHRLRVEEFNKQQNNLEKQVEKIKKISPSKESRARALLEPLQQLRDMQAPASHAFLHYNGELHRASTILKRLQLKTDLRMCIEKNDIAESVNTYRELLALYDPSSSQAAKYTEKLQQTETYLAALNARAEGLQKINEIKTTPYKQQKDLLRDLAAQIKIVRDTYQHDEREYTQYHQRYVSLQQQQAPLTTNEAERAALFKDI